MKPSEFNLTKHAIQRMLERFPNVKAKFDAEPSSSLRLKAMYDLFKGAEECKSFVNDTKFMLYIQERYGADNRYAFFILVDAIFVGVVNEQGSNIVTVLRKSFHRSAHLRNA